jgi:multidrug resistance protein, MATE family
MALRYRDIVLYGGIGLAFVQSLTLFVFRNSIAGIFTNIDTIKELLDSAFKIVSFGLFFECVQLSLQGIFRGLGKQSLAFYMIVISFYFIGLPLSYLIGISWQYGIDGLWIGIMIGVGILAVTYVYMAKFHFDWQRIADEAEDRA